MRFGRREFLYLSVLAATLPDMARRAFAQAQPAAPKFNQILRQDLESQGQKVEETVAIATDFGPGSVSPWHMHPGAQELLFVSDGRLTLEVDGRETKVINAGGSGHHPR